MRSLAVVLLFLFPLALMPLFIHPVSAAHQALVFAKPWGGNKTDVAYGVAANKTDGSIYVVGETSSFNQAPTAAFILKYNSSGGLVWQETWGASNGTSHANAVTLDDAGNIYVTGYTNSFGGGAGRNVLVLKLNPAGGIIWQRTWGTTSDDVGNAIAYDSSSGRIIIAGTDTSPSGDRDVLILKIAASSGSLLSYPVYHGSGDDEGNGVAVDASGNIYVTGFTDSFGSGGKDVLMMKISSTGSLLWQETWGGTGLDEGYGVALDSGGNIYVSGDTNSYGAGNADILLLKVTSTGSGLSAITLGGNQTDKGLGDVVDASGNVYVAGFSESYGGGFLPIVSLYKFNSSSLVSLTTIKNGVGTGYAVTLDNSGNAIMAGDIALPTLPYTVGTGNLILANQIKAAPASGLYPVALIFPSSTPTVVPQTPPGVETYGGGTFDSLIVKTGSVVVPLSPMVVLTSMLAASALFLHHRHMRK